MEYNNGGSSGAPPPSGEGAAAADSGDRFLMANISNPHPDNDVLMGRGSTAHNHPGNVRHRSLVLAQKESYAALKGGGQKSNLAMELVLDWRRQDPPGRFLRKNEETNLWNDIGNELAREKTARLLRNRFTDDERAGASAGSKRNAEADAPPLPPPKKPRAEEEEAGPDGGQRLAAGPAGPRPGVPAALGQIPEPYVRMMHEMNRCIGALTETARHLGARVEGLERRLEGLLAADGGARRVGVAAGGRPAPGAVPPAVPDGVDDDDRTDERREWDALASAVKREPCPTRKFVAWVSEDGGGRYAAWRNASRAKAPPQEGSFRRAMDNFCRKVTRLAGEEVPPRPADPGDLGGWEEELARIGERAMLNAQSVFGARPTYSWLREWSGNMNQHQHVNAGAFEADKTTVNV